MTNIRSLQCRFLCLLVSFAFLADANAAEDPQPGPEDGGMRLRLVVAPREAEGGEGYDVRINVLNTSEHAIVLQSAWRHEDPGDVRAYLEAATSIESEPAFAPWMGGVQEGMRKSPQPQQTLEPGETLSIEWQTEGRKLKNRVTNPLVVQNPTLFFAGLYAVHATLDVPTSTGVVRLRSNEQLVSVGGSQAAPKHTYGQLGSVNREKREARLGLGSLHKIAVGDKFEIGSPKGMHWRLTLTEVEATHSVGTLELLTRVDYAPYREPPPQYAPATLIIDPAAK